MLQKIMKDINQDQDPANHKKPCDVFDLICGTSTGGLIALMLGRLEYTVDEAIVEYLKLGKEIFEKKESRRNATYSHETLEKCLKEVIEASPINTAKNPELLYKPEKEGRCKIFIVTTSLLEDTPQPVVLRDYDIRSGSGSTTRAFRGTIWEAGRCTSAAPTYFRSIIVETADGPQTYSDGGTIANNPINEAIAEACRLWDPRRIELIVSLGAGPEKAHTLSNSPKDVMGPWGARSANLVLPKSYYFKAQLAAYAVQALTSTERLHHRAEAMVESFQDPLKHRSFKTGRRQIYFRLNPSDPAAQVDLAAWPEMRKLQDIAGKYMDNDIVALSYRRMIAAFIKERILRPYIEPKLFALGEEGPAHDARQIMKKECRFPVQILNMKSDPQETPSLVDRLFRCHRRSVASEPRKFNFTGAYNYNQISNIISERLVRDLKIPFDSAKADELRERWGKPFSRTFEHAAIIDIAVKNESGEPHDIENVCFYIAENVSLPCDVILGRETFTNKKLGEHMPRLDYEERTDFSLLYSVISRNIEQGNMFD